MNHPYIRQMCEAYYNDMQLGKSKIWKDKDSSVSELFSEMVGLMNNLKLEDEPAYFEIHTLGTGQQQKILYFLMTEYMSQKYDMFNIIEDVDVARYESAEAFIMDSFAGGIGQMIGGAGNVVGGAARATFGVLGSASAAAAANPATAVLGIAVSIIAFIALYKQISKAGWSILSALNTANKAVAQFINEKTRSGRVKRAILVNNLDTCFKRCNIDPNNLSRWAGMALTNSILSTPKAKQQADCLSYCYLDWTLNQVGVIAKGYADCVRGSGERGTDISDITIFLQTPVNACKDYHSLIVRHHSDYNDAIEVLFQSDSGIREQWRRKYNEELQKALSSGGRPNPTQRPQFDNPRGPRR